MQSPPRQPDPAAPPPRTRSRRRTLIIAGLFVVAFEAVVLVGALWYFGHFGSRSTNVLDVRQAEAGVRQILSDPINGYGANEVQAVECNDGQNPRVKAGAGFSCRVRINGADRDVQVVFRDDAGTYEVDGPR